MSQERASNPRRTALITGAATGVGRAAAAELAQRGWFVFAGVLPGQDTAEVAAALGGNGQVVELDVTDGNAIADAAAKIMEAGPLHALVNNAGIATFAPTECVPLDNVRHHLEINAIGALALTQALLPALRETRGRVVFVGSPAGRAAAPMTGAYSASKSALAALADAMRAELSPAGVGIALVEPGVTETELAVTSRAATQRLVERFAPEGHRRYAGMIEAYLRQSREKDGAGHRLAPEAVAALIAEVLTTTRLKPRYQIGKDARIMAFLGVVPAKMRATLMRKKMDWFVQQGALVDKEAGGAEAAPESGVSSKRD